MRVKYRSIFQITCLLTLTLLVLGSPYVQVQATSSVQMTVSYSIVGGGSPTAPVFHYFLNGVRQKMTLSGVPTVVTVDAGSAWSVTPNPLGGSSSSERWYSTQPLKGTALATTVQFVFQHQYHLIMRLNPPFAGFVTPGSGWYDPGAKVTITATGDHYDFSSWTGSGSGSYTGTKNPARITMNSAITETANFT